MVPCFGMFACAALIVRLQHLIKLINQWTHKILIILLSISPKLVGRAPFRVVLLVSGACRLLWKLRFKTRLARWTFEISVIGTMSLETNWQIITWAFTHISWVATSQWTYSFRFLIHTSACVHTPWTSPRPMTLKLGLLKIATLFDIRSVSLTPHIDILLSSPSHAFLSGLYTRRVARYCRRPSLLTSRAFHAVGTELKRLSNDLSPLLEGRAILLSDIDPWKGS